jgi:hypothetical protein
VFNHHTHQFGGESVDPGAKKQKMKRKKTQLVKLDSINQLRILLSLAVPFFQMR